MFRDTQPPQRLSNQDKDRVRDLTILENSKRNYTRERERERDRLVIVGEESKEDENYCQIIEPMPKAIPSKTKELKHNRERDPP